MNWQPFVLSKMTQFFYYKQLLNNYTVTDKIQLVRIPTYISALVTDSLEAAHGIVLRVKVDLLALLLPVLIVKCPISATGNV